VTVDFAKALQLSIPDEHAALKRWYETVSTRPSRGRLILPGATILVSVALSVSESHPPGVANAGPLNSVSIAMSDQIPDAHCGARGGYAVCHAKNPSA